MTPLTPRAYAKKIVERVEALLDRVPGRYRALVRATVALALTDTRRAPPAAEQSDGAGRNSSR